MTWSRSPLGQLRLGPILGYGCNDITIARGIVVNKSRSPITVNLRELFSSTHEAVISVGRRPHSCQKCPAGISDGACGGCVPENDSTSVSGLAGRSLRILGHKNRQDGAAGDDVRILRKCLIPWLSTVFPSVQVAQSLRDLWLDTLILR